VKAFRVAVIVLIAVLSSACAAGTYSKSSLENHLEKVGVKPAKATCVLDKMATRFGNTRLNARTDPIAAEFAAERTVLRKCGVGTSPPQ
jgi:hypothetical protein